VSLVSYHPSTHSWYITSQLAVNGFVVALAVFEILKVGAFVEDSITQVHFSPESKAFVAALRIVLVIPAVN